MYISSKDWNNYITKLSACSKTAAAKMKSWVQKNGFSDTDAMIDYAYALVTKYGEGAAALSAEMYDAIADMQGKLYAPAEMASTPEHNEVGKAINGVLKHSRNTDAVSAPVDRLVKRTGADTILKNAVRDRAQFAWIPNGDTCAFCLTLASRGWQDISEKALKNGHAEHIHAHCDCTYAVRFDDKSGVQGYDPDKYREMYDNAEGDTPEEKINSMRRMQYAKDKDEINAKKREAYRINKEADFFVGKNKKVLPKEFEGWIGNNKMEEYLNNAESDAVIRYIKSDFRKTSFIGDGSTVAIREFEISTGLRCGRNGNTHETKVKDLIRQIDKILLKDLSHNDKIFLEKMLDRLKKVDT